MIKLNGNNAYFVPPKNRYGLSTNETFDLTEHDFSILVNVKIEWDKMTADSPTQEGGIVAKNGQHCGLNAFKFNDGRTYIKEQWWVKSDVGLVEYKDIWFDVEGNLEFMNVSMVHDHKTKTITLSVDGESMDGTYEGEIIDYRDSWIWVGANNSLDSCAVEHQGFLFGTINHVSIFDSVVSDDDIRTVFSTNSNEIFEPSSELKTAAAFTFKDTEMTPYKVFDISLNGNHMILFDNKWMAANLI